MTTAGVPFLDLARLHDSVRDDLHRVLDEVIDESRFVGAAASAGFEAAFASAHGRAGGVGCGSGTDALALALRAAGIGPGDEVVVPSMTFVATAEAVCLVGATPVIADVAADTLLLTDAAVAEVRSPRTRAVVPVHLYGNPVPFDLLAGWRDSGLVVVEDAAQAHLATWEGSFVGSVGHAACFSFYPGKNLGALGDGGMVLSDDRELLGAVARLRDHGRTAKYRHDELGVCSRLDGVQAAWLQIKLEHLPRWTDERRRVAARYLGHLGDRLVRWSAGAVHHLVVARFPEDRLDEVAAELTRRGIGVGRHYPVPLSLQPSLAPWHRRCPMAEQAADQVLSLPVDPNMSDADVDRVCETVAVLG